MFNEMNNLLFKLGCFTFIIGIKGCLMYWLVLVLILIRLSNSNICGNMINYRQFQPIQEKTIAKQNKHIQHVMTC